MAYTLASIRQRVIEDKLGDTDYDTAVVDRFINDAQRDLFNNYELSCNEKVFSGTLPAAGTAYKFPSGHQRIQALKVVSPVDSINDITNNYVPFRDFNTLYPTPSTNSEGPPLVWTVYGGTLYFHRPTDREYILETYYIKTADGLTDGAHVPEIPEEFQEVLILGAYYRVLERNEDFDLARYYKTGDYAAQRDAMVARLGVKQNGAPTIMGQPRRSSNRMM